MLVLFVLTLLRWRRWSAQQAQASPAAPAAAPQAEPPAASAGPRPMELADIIAWKNVGATALSNDGRGSPTACRRWKATARCSSARPTATRSTSSRSARRRRRAAAPAGPARGGPPSASLGFSEDSKWVAFMVLPDPGRERSGCAGSAGPSRPRCSCSTSASGKDVTIENVRRFAFSGERGGWIALQKAPAPRRAGRRCGPPPAPGGAPARRRGGGERAAEGHGPHPPRTRDRPRAERRQRRRVRVRQDGKFLALVIDAPDKVGNGVQLRNMETGVVSVLDSDKASYERLAWTEKGDGLRVLKGTEDKRYKDKVYAVVGFTELRRSRQARRRRSTTRPPTRPSPRAWRSARTATPAWTEDLSALALRHPHAEEVRREARAGEGRREGRAAGRAAGEARRRRRRRPRPTTPDEEKPDLVLWHYKDPRLQSQQQVQEEMDKNFSYLSHLPRQEKKFIRLADDTCAA